MEKNTITELMQWIGEIKKDAERYINNDDTLSKLRYLQQEQLSDTITVQQINKTVYIISLSAEIELNQWGKMDETEQLLLWYANFDKQTFIKTLTISDLIYFFSRFEELSELINNDTK